MLNDLRRRELHLKLTSLVNTTFMDYHGSYMIYAGPSTYTILWNMYPEHNDLLNINGMKLKVNAYIPEGKIIIVTGGRR